MLVFPHVFKLYLTNLISAAVILELSIVWKHNNSINLNVKINALKIKVHNIQRGPKKTYSLFDSQYLCNKVTCRYNSCAEREWVIICVWRGPPQRLKSVDAAELLSELRLSVCLVWWLHMTLRWFLVAHSVWLASNLSRIRAIVWRVCGRVPNSFCHCRCTSLLFSYFQYHFNTALRCSKDNFSAIVAAVYRSQRPRSTTFTWHIRKHYTTVPRKNCNYMSLCSKDTDYQRVSTFLWTPLY
jgi:hypothetical protein